MEKWKTAAQGEVYLKRLNSLPVPRGWAKLGAASEHVTRLKEGNDGGVAIRGASIVIGHSETGHHHVVAEDDVEVYERPETSEGMRILRMIVANTNKARASPGLRHPRPALA